MPKYWAICSERHIQVDERTGQLEVYEYMAQAMKMNPPGCAVVAIEILAHEDQQDTPDDS